MNTYTLHAALALDEGNLRDAVVALPMALAIHVTEVFCEGDSFLEWMEEPKEGDAIHAMIDYEAEDDQRAWALGVSIYLDLLQHPDPPVSLYATCLEGHNEPFAISTKEDWGCQLTRDGRSGDLLSWRTSTARTGTK